MSGILFDTSVYISALRQGDSSILALRRASHVGEADTRPLWLSVVVLEELYAGATSAGARKAFARMEREFDRIGRLIVPDKRDWTLARQVLARLGLKYGFELIRKTKMTNDALIATSTAGRGLTVLTKNPVDYQRLAEFHPFNWQFV